MFEKDTTGKLQGLKDKMFGFVKNNKKNTIAALVLFAIGGIGGNSTTISQEEYDNNKVSIATINQEITNYESQHTDILEEVKVLTTQKQELAGKVTTLTADKSSLTVNTKTEETRIASEEKAKAEADRVAAEQAAKAEAERIAAEQAAANANSYVYGSSDSASTAVVNEDSIGSMVWITRTGSKYHSHDNCGNSQYVSQVTREQAEAKGLGPCSKCY